MEKFINIKMTVNNYVINNIETLDINKFLVHHNEYYSNETIKNILKRYSKSTTLHEVDSPYGLVFSVCGTNYYGEEFNGINNVDIISNLEKRFQIKILDPLKVGDKKVNCLYPTNIINAINVWSIMGKYNVSSEKILENTTKAIQYYGIYYSLRDMFPNFNFYCPMYTQLTTAFWADKEDYIQRIQQKTDIVSILELITHYFSNFIACIKTTYNYLTQEDIFNPQAKNYLYYNKTKEQLLQEFEKLCPEKTTTDISSDKIIDILKIEGNIYKKFFKCFSKLSIKQYFQRSFEKEISDKDFNLIFGEDHFDINPENPFMDTNDIQTIISNFKKETADLDITPYRIFMLKHVILEEITNAFKAVLKHSENHVKKNIVLYGYSQGAQLIIELLQLINKLTFENTEEGQIYEDLKILYENKNNILCSYIPGVALTGKNIAEGLLPARKEIDEYKGACISFNSELSGVKLKSSAIIRKDTRINNKIYAINPINWSTSQLESLSKFNSIKFWKVQNDNSYKLEELPDRIMAYLDQYGILKVTIIKKSDIPLGLTTDENPTFGSKFVRGCLHWYDLWFYYNEIAENVLKRYHYFNN